MHSGAQSYYRTATVTMTPRQLEASLLLKAAARLQAVAEDWDGRRSELPAALDYDRKLWTILVAALAKPENPMRAPSGRT